MRRVRLTFWVLVVTAVISTGVLMGALDWSAGSAAGITVGAAGLVTAVALALATRILVVVSRGRRTPPPGR